MRAKPSPGPGRADQRRAFTLVEIMVVIAIISLLIGILLPSINQARTQAKNLKTKGTMRAIDTALEAFKNDNGKEFRNSNGYPPSAGYDPQRFPATSSHEYRRDVHAGQNPPSYELWGAQWLPRMLLGKDLHGFVRAQDVPELDVGTESLRNRPDLWYEQEPIPGRLEKPLPRVGPYLDPGDVALVHVDELLIVDKDDAELPDENREPVIVDPFDRPILYYVANPRIARNPLHPLATRMDGVLNPGIYNFRDNVGFTGFADSNIESCDFGGGPHLIREFGDVEDPGAEPDSFIYYIHNHGIGHDETQGATHHDRVAPHNPDSYLLITAGKDAVYGNADDVNNFERSQ